MPWTTRANGDHYCVYKTGSSMPVPGGCHATREEAEKHRRALYASEAASASTATLAPVSGLAESAEVETSTDEGREQVFWEGLLGVEGRPTSDGRYLIPGLITERDLPIPLMAQTITAERHDGARLVGSITEIWREPQEDDTIEIWGRGPFDMGGEFGREAARLVEEEYLTGVSLDIGGTKNSLLDPETFEPVQQDGEIDLVSFLGGEFLVGIEGEIMGATLVPFPAFAEAKVSSADESPTTVDPRLAAALDRLSLVTQKERFEGYKLGMELGLLSVNDCLARENLPPVEGGDERAHPFANASNGSPAPAPEPAPAPAAALPTRVELIVNRDEMVADALVSALGQITDRLAAGEKINEAVVSSLRQFAELQATAPNINFEPQIDVHVPETPVNVTLERGAQHVEFIRDDSGRISDAFVEEAEPTIAGGA